MFEKNDIENKNVDCEYFQILNKTCYHLTLKSRNTGHTWDITCRDNPKGRSIQVFHKHKDADAFHEQPMFHPRSITEAQDLIKKHDRWQLNHKKQPGL